jgi:hypothetical protein
MLLNCIAETRQLKDGLVEPALTSLACGKRQVNSVLYLLDRKYTTTIGTCIKNCRHQRVNLNLGNSGACQSSVQGSPASTSIYAFDKAAIATEHCPIRSSINGGRSRRLALQGQPAAVAYNSIIRAGV